MYGDELMTTMEAENRIRIRQFIDYIRSFWMERIGPIRFCVFMDLHRTNNLLEAFHSMLNDLMGNPRPNSWHFLGKTILI